jgi:uncharacterized protein
VPFSARQSDASIFAARGRVPSPAVTQPTSLPPAPEPAPRLLYGHGFASSRTSHKGVVLAEHFARRGAHLELLDLRRPSLEHLRLSAILATIGAAIGGPTDRAVLFGSSLGGLAACRVAERDPRVCALVLLAPAFRIAERWRARLGETAWRRWQEEDAIEITDYAARQKATVDFGFALDAAAIDAAGDGWPDVRVPTLVIQGQSDDTVDPALARAWASGKRHVKLVEVDDGHELVASLPRIIAEADAWLTPWLGPAI